jgi:hypothetical protein
MIRIPIALLILAASLSASGMEGYTVPGLENTDVMMSIHVWGEVATPGTHLVPVSADLIAGISAAGGPTGTASLSDVRIVYDSTETTYDLGGFLEGDGEPVPRLMPGATVYLRTRSYEWWKDVVDFTYKIIVTGNVIWMIFK